MNDWTNDRMPKGDDIEKMSRKELRDGLHHFVDRVETAQGGTPVQMLFVMRAQYLRDELAHRDQDRQTQTMICMTVAITVMTLVITVMTAVIMLRG